MTKALFFDVDGTLVSFNTHRIPQSAVDALAEAKRRGAMVFISTGRPMRLINNLDAIQHLVDGYITANGACCSVGGETIACREIPAPEARALTGAAGREGFAMLVVGESRLTVVNDGADVDRYFRQMLAVSDLGEGTALTDVLAERIVQLTPIIDEAAERRLMPLLPSCVSARWFPAFTDIGARSRQGHGSHDRGCAPWHQPRGHHSLRRRRKRQEHSASRRHGRGHGQRPGRREGRGRLRYRKR